MVKKVFRSTYRIFTLALLIIFAIIATGIIVGEIYKDEIRNYVISEINSEIEVKVNISSSDLSVWRKFPYISIVLNDAIAFSGKNFNRSDFDAGSADTLFTASRIYLQFNLIDIIRQNYNLKRVHAVDGKVNILTDKTGGVNYLFTKEKKTGGSKDFAIELEGVKLSGFDWEYINRVKNIYSKGQIREIALKGKFSQNSFSLNSASSVFIETFRSEEIEYAPKLALSSRLILDVQDSVFSIRKGDLEVNHLSFRTGGSVVTGTKTLLDIKIAGKDLDIKDLFNRFPINNREILKYSPTGKVQILAKITGEIGNDINPLIRSAFQIENGKIFIPALESYISGIELKGTFSNGSRHNSYSSRLNLSEYSVNYGENKLYGAFSIQNFNSPSIEATMAGTILARDLSGIINIEGLALAQGIIYPDLAIKINVKSFNEFDLSKIPSGSVNGSVAFKEVSGNIPNTDLELYLLEGNMKINGNEWLPEFKLKLGKNIISADLSVKNAWEYLVGRTKIPVISGIVVSEYLVLPDFLPETDSSESIDFQLPDSIYLNLNCKADSFIYGKFLAANLETSFAYKPGLLNVTYLKMNTMKGKATAAGVIIGDNQGQMLLKSSGEMQNIDIHQLFYAMNNFAQDFVVSENLMGSVSGKLDFSAYISPQLDLLTKGLTAQSEFVIKNGELINFEPITELSDFVELSELQHIRFSTLKNSILIKDEKAYIPQMDINSSAFNITISGTHNFENYFEYKMKLNLSEYLARKAKKAKKENEEFGVEAEDVDGGTNIYLSIIGTPDDFKIRYDKKEAVNQIKTDLQEEKKLLKTILKEELGLFKKDSVNSSIIDPGLEKNQFKMDWGEENNSQPEPEKEIKKKKKDPEFIITWDDEDSN